MCFSLEMSQKNGLSKNYSTVLCATMYIFGQKMTQLKAAKRVKLTVTLERRSLLRPLSTETKVRSETAK